MIHILYLIIIIILIIYINKSFFIETFINFKNESDIVLGINLNKIKWNISKNYNLEESTDTKIKKIINNSIFIDNNYNKLLESNIFLAENIYYNLNFPLYEKYLENNLYSYTILNYTYIREKININDIVFFKHLEGYFKIKNI